MDQKRTSTGLDPELKATYDRIMAIPTSPTSNQSVQQYIPPAPVQPISVPPIQTSSSTIPATQSVAAPASSHVISQPAPVPAQQPIRRSYAAGKFATGAPILHQEKKSSHIFLISSIIAGMILFGIYVLFWLKFFNIPVGY